MHPSLGRSLICSPPHLPKHFPPSWPSSAWLKSEFQTSPSDHSIPLLPFQSFQMSLKYHFKNETDYGTQAPPLASTFRCILVHHPGLRPKVPSPERPWGHLIHIKCVKQAWAVPSDILRKGMSQSPQQDPAPVLESLGLMALTPRPGDHKMC